MDFSLMKMEFGDTKEDWEAFVDVAHDGLRETMNQVRQDYFTAKFRQHLKKLSFRCVTCRKYEGKPYKYLQPSDLTESRLKECVL